MQYHKKNVLHLDGRGVKENNETQNLCVVIDTIQAKLTQEGAAKFSFIKPREGDEKCFFFLT